MTGVVDLDLHYGNYDDARADQFCKIQVSDNHKSSRNVFPSSSQPQILPLCIDQGNNVLLKSKLSQLRPI